ERAAAAEALRDRAITLAEADAAGVRAMLTSGADAPADPRSEEHTSELQSRFDLVCRLLLEKKKHNNHARTRPSYDYGRTLLFVLHPVMSSLYRGSLPRLALLLSSRCYADHQALPSFPTRRSSDLERAAAAEALRDRAITLAEADAAGVRAMLTSGADAPADPSAVPAQIGEVAAAVGRLADLLVEQGNPRLHADAAGAGQLAAAAGASIDAILRSNQG